MSDNIFSFETLVVALAMIMAYGPVIALIVARKRLGALKTATALVIWGTLTPTFEHASFAIYGSRTIPSLPGHGLHLHYHFFMAGIFTVVAGIMIMIMALTQLRKGKRTGWYAILVALLIGGSFELSGAAGMRFHGFQGPKMGLGIYAYILAWASALVISYRAVFEDKQKSHERPGAVQSKSKH